MTKPNPDRRSILALLGIAVGGFGAGVGGGLAVMAPAAAKAPAKTLPAFLDIEMTGTSGKFLVSNGETVQWMDLEPYKVEHWRSYPVHDGDYAPRLYHMGVQKTLIEQMAPL